MILEYDYENLINNILHGVQRLNNIKIINICTSFVYFCFSYKFTKKNKLNMKLDDKKLIFIHIPRTGGTSIETSLNPDRIGSVHFTLNEAITRWGIDLVKEYLTFSFIRNPFSRILSVYSYRISGGNKSGKDWKLASELPLTFNDFIFQIEQFNDSHYKPLSYWLENQLIQLDFIGRFENLAQDFEKLCSHLAITTPVLPHIRKSQHLHWKKYYNREMKKKMLDVFYDDFKSYYPEYLKIE